jgi:hypothetical protein
MKVTPDGTAKLANKGSPRLRSHVSVGSYWGVVFANLRARLACGGRAGHKEISGTQTQLPIELAFCSTIHKVQGVTLKALLADTSVCFEFCQAYVAISRFKAAEELQLLSPLTVEQLRRKVSDGGGKLCTLAAGIVAEEQRLQLLHTATMALPLDYLRGR